MTLVVYNGPHKEDFAVDARQRLELMRSNPERYATTGLDWGNPAHHDGIAEALFQALIGVLARQQEYLGKPEMKLLRHQQARVEQRLSVAERVLWRDGRASPRAMEDQVVVLCLEKMADAFEEGAGAWVKAREENGKNVMAGTMLGVGVCMAGMVRSHGALGRFSIGPFGGLSRIAGLVTRPDVALEMKDLLELNVLVGLAREIPVGEVVTPNNESASFLCDGVYRLQVKLQKRDREQEFGC